MTSIAAPRAAERARAQESPLAPGVVAAAVARATRAIAPVWPLRHFVAVNPFLGLTDRPFGDAARRLAQVAGARLTMPRAFYAEAIRRGRITDAHLAAALDAARADATRASALPSDVVTLRALALGGDGAAGPEALATVADALGRATGRDWARLVTDRFSAWAAGYFDDGQASWRSPWRDLPPYGAWREEAALDPTLELMGVRGFRAAVRRLPGAAEDAIAHALATLGVPDEALELYLHRLLMSVGGWAAWGRYRVWESELDGDADDTLVQLLAIRIGYEAALRECTPDTVIWSAWRDAVRALSRAAAHPIEGTSLAVDLVLHQAYELGWQQSLLSRIAAHASRGGDTPDEGRTRPAVQAVFCIDVRSEPYRRALEATDPAVETLGFAGFFGIPLEYVPVGDDHGGARCPVLLAPSVVVAESVGEDARRTAWMAELRRRARRASVAWKSFASGAVSCFGFVESLGLGYARRLVTDSFGRTRPVPSPVLAGLPREAHEQLKPTLHEGGAGGRLTGILPADRLEIAERVLRAMSLRDRFARLVLLVGHGSTSVNNPHATGLDCGACGGHDGAANARVAAAVLNDPFVRFGLAKRGIRIPRDTLFLPALHDTTTDEVTILDASAIPWSHAEELSALRERLALASRRARAARAPGLRLASLADEERDARILARGSDWSQVRPEWGLAGCAAFIAAPRRRTAGLDLGGRAFLHSYEWRQDEGFGVLELIMTAPMVVASWISLQYFGSTVDNRVFGAGNKVLHNVVGALGVLEGNAGDLRTGLPWQSVHDGERFVHEPVRLDVVIEAPVDAMTGVIARHANVRALLDNGWLRLWAMDEAGTVAWRYAGGLEWVAVEETPAGATA